MTTRSAVYLAANVRAHRTKLGMSQKDFAEYISWPQSRISEVENANADKWLSYIDKLADAMGVDTHSLLRPRKLADKLQAKLEKISANA